MRSIKACAPEGAPLEPGAPSELGVAELYRTYAAWLVAALRRRGGGEASEDIAQETFLRASAYAPDELSRHPKALLLTIARRLTLNAARDAARQKRDPGGYLVPGSQAADQDQRLLLAEMVATIPQPYRDTFMLSRFGGKSYAEIADALGVSVKVVEWRMSRALAICMAHLRD